MALLPRAVCLSRKVPNDLVAYFRTAQIVDLLQIFIAVSFMKSHEADESFDEQKTSGQLSHNELKLLEYKKQQSHDAYHTLIGLYEHCVGDSRPKTIRSRSDQSQPRSLRSSSDMSSVDRTDPTHRSNSVDRTDPLLPTHRLKSMDRIDSPPLTHRLNPRPEQYVSRAPVIQAAYVGKHGSKEPKRNKSGPGPNFPSTPSVYSEDVEPREPTLYVHGTYHNQNQFPVDPKDRPARHNRKTTGINS